MTSPSTAQGEVVEPLDSIPLSALNAIVYCPRRYYYEYVLGEMEVNAHVMSGRYAHQRVDSGQRTRDEDGVTLRRLYVWSDRLRIHGYTDVVEEDPAGRMRPVEYKHGRMGDWPGDQIQLCAQALCLEERTGQPIDSGDLYYIGSRQHRVVSLTPELRAATEETIATALALSRQPKLPLPLRNPRRCEPCSLRPFCLPDEVWALRDSTDVAAASANANQGPPGKEDKASYANPIPDRTVQHRQEKRGRHRRTSAVLDALQGSGGDNRRR